MRFSRGHIPLSDHFNGQVFFNPWSSANHKFSDFLRVLPVIYLSSWPKWVNIAKFPPPKKSVEQGIEYSVINHATVLIQTEGVNILTDPVWADRVSPVSFAGPRRVHDPGIAFEDLPQIHIVLISHNHYDHLELETLRWLEKKFQPQFFTSLGDELYLKSKGLNRVKELDWWEFENAHSLKIQFVPSQHFSGRGILDRNHTLWGGFWIESKNAKIYFAGDTGYGPFFTEIREKLGAPDLAFFPIGSYEPRWFMGPVHMNPEDAVKAHRDMNSKMSVGIHYGCFRLTSEPIEEPAEFLQQALLDYRIDKRNFLAPEWGKVYKAGF